MKGDFCTQVRTILTHAGRERDYVEVGLDSGLGNNPLHNDLDLYAVAYAIRGGRGVSDQTIERFAFRAHATAAPNPYFCVAAPCFDGSDTETRTLGCRFIGLIYFGSTFWTDRDAMNSALRAS